MLTWCTSIVSWQERCTAAGFAVLPSREVLGTPKGGGHPKCQRGTAEGMRTKHSLGLSTGIPNASAWMIPRSQDRLHPFWPQGNKVDMLIGQCRCSY